MSLLSRCATLTTRSRHVAGIVLLSLAAACGGGTEPAAPAPASMRIVSGDAQTATAGADLAQPLVVVVLDAQGQPVSGQTVSFRVTGGGGSLSAGSAVTSASGTAQVRWTLGRTASLAQTAEASVLESGTGVVIASVSFHATATAGAASRIVMLSGDGQTVTAGTALRDSLAVRVSDQNANPVSGATVRWTIVSGGGTLSVPSSVTSSAGFASVRWTAGPTAGGAEIQGSVAGVSTSASFLLTVVAP